MVFVQHDPQTVAESELFDGGDWDLKSFLHVPPDQKPRAAVGLTIACGS